MAIPTTKSQILDFFGCTEDYPLVFYVPNGAVLGMHDGCALSDNIETCGFLLLDSVSFNTPIKIQFRNSQDIIEETIIVIFPYSIADDTLVGQFLFNGKMVDYRIGTL